MSSSFDNPTDSEGYNARLFMNKLTGGAIHFDNAWPIGRVLALQPTISTFQVPRRPNMTAKLLTSREVTIELPKTTYEGTVHWRDQHIPVKGQISCDLSNVELMNKNEIDFSTTERSRGYIRVKWDEKTQETTVQRKLMSIDQGVLWNYKEGVDGRFQSVNEDNGNEEGARLISELNLELLNGISERRARTQPTVSITGESVQDVRNSVEEKKLSTLDKILSYIPCHPTSTSDRLGRSIGRLRRAPYKSERRVVYEDLNVLICIAAQPKMDFDIIPYEDIQWSQRLGAGSFGSVYKGSYLGIDIAIKEVLPSTEYDVHKYFEREWRIMRECRHPNIVLFLGLSKAPGDDGRVFIISEFVPRGNLRQYILSSHPFPWRLRLSFATDVARAVAYLHARQCIHRDLKGENLLITSNERVKVTDFGFARIASRNADEMRRMTYCGTDGYMSPEIMNGLDFDLPTDVFSLGIIFIEIMSRRLVDSKTYTRQAPHFTPDPSEVIRRASPGCPPALISLALSCTQEDPNHRPRMPEVLTKLREIEVEVLSKLDDPISEHVGSIRLVHRGGKRAMPIFDGGDRNDHPTNMNQIGEEEKDRKDEEEVLRKLAEIHLDISGKGASSALSNSSSLSGNDHMDDNEKWRTARWNDLGYTPNDSILTFKTASSDVKGQEPLLPSSDSGSSFGSAKDSNGNGQGWSSFLGGGSASGEPVQTASVLRAATPGPPSEVNTDHADEEMGSTMTIKGHPTPTISQQPPLDYRETTLLEPKPSNAVPPVKVEDDTATATVDLTISEIGSIPSLPSSITPIKRKDQKPKSPNKTSAMATHRFTLVDKDSVPLINGKKALSSNFTSTFAFAFFPRALAPTPSPSKNDNPAPGGGGKCAVCMKKMGGRAGLQCDDCHLIVHVKCSHIAPRNCTGGDGKIH
nr:TKL/LISK/LISK-DD1 protein kinase [Kwoniella mangroviensis CBS 8507]OCF69745.1 TKL/LISK/LISK-DD1 protein kinase [Kwoniella mangroviensis CBS 8507]